MLKADYSMDHLLKELTSKTKGTPEIQKIVIVFGVEREREREREKERERERDARRW